MDFRQIKIDDIYKYNSCLTGDETNSESSFANMYAWRNAMNTMIYFDEDNCYFIYTKRDGRTACCFPRGKNPLMGIQRLYDYFKNNNISFIMESLTEKEVNFIQDNFSNITINPDPDLDDYVYSGEKLRSLSGKKLHSKRNHINKFKAMYLNYKYVQITPSYIDRCIEFTDWWLMNKWGSAQSEDYINEMNSVTEFLTNFQFFGLSGGILMCDERIIAFTIGEKLNKNTCVVHVEKADTQYEGAYTMINNLYISENWPEIEYVNREEDMGIEGIRKAKNSYYPDIMIKKYSIIFQ